MVNQPLPRAIRFRPPVIRAISMLATLSPTALTMVAGGSMKLAVLASLGPIVVFFGLSTKSYPFMVLLNVAGIVIRRAYLLQQVFSQSAVRCFDMCRYEIVL